MDKSFSLLDLCLIFLRQKRRILIHFVSVVAVSVAISYVIPKNYKATTLFLPPYSENSGLTGLSLGITLNLGRESAFTPQQIESLLDSRRVLEATVKRFDLIRLYKTQKLPNKTERAIKTLKMNTKLATVTDAALTQRLVTHYTLSVVDKDRRRAADMANFMVAELGRVMDEMSRSQYRYSADFIASRLDSIGAQKSAIQQQLALFQKTNKVYSPEMKEQVLGSISIYAELRKERILAEMERDLLLFELDKQSHEVRVAERKIQGLDKKLKAIELGSEPDVLPGLNYSVDIAYTYLNLMEEAEVLTKLELLLRQQYEEASIRAARLAPTVRVVDAALPPEWKNFPKKAYIVLGVTLAYMTLLLIFILASHGVSRASAGTKARLREFREALRFRNP